MARVTTDAPAVGPSLQHRETWKLPHYLAALAIVFLFWEGWTLVSWLADGPQSVTQFRNRDSANWWAARTYEGLGLLMASSASTSCAIS